MRVALFGGSGLIGRALAARLKPAGAQILNVVRRAPKDNNEARWDPASKSIDGAKLEGCDAFINLAGESIAEGRWNESKKKRILDSRIDSTTLVASTIARLASKPKVLVNASAIGFYGDRGNDIMTEDSPAGHGYLPEVCRAWETATAAAEQAGVRVAKIRISMVLSKQGGALKKMLLPFKMGVGGVVGSGNQYMSWITIDDMVRVLDFALKNDGCYGPINAASPGACTNREFTKALGKALSRPTIFPMPAFGARLAFGEMADALILASTRVQPTRLKALGFEFEDPEITKALQDVLKS